MHVKWTSKKGKSPRTFRFSRTLIPALSLSLSRPLAHMCIYDEQR